MRSLLLVAALLAAPAAWAQPAEGPVDGWQVQQVLTRRAGELAPVFRANEQVELVRSGAEQPLPVDAVAGAGDALRCARGAVRLAGSDGEALWLGERSQLRFDTLHDLQLRFGELIVVEPTTITVSLEGLQIRAVNAQLRVERDIPGSGLVVVQSGDVVILAGSDELPVPPGHELRFGPEGLGALALAEPDAWTSHLPPPLPQAPAEAELHPSRADRLHLGLDGGLLLLGDGDFLDVALHTRLRLVGPLWVHLGGGVGLRPEDGGLDSSPSLVAPLSAGVQIVGDLGRSLALVGGADFSAVVLERCEDSACLLTRWGVDPGVRGRLGLLLLATRDLGLGLQVAGGVDRRRIPPQDDASDFTYEPAPALEVTAGITLRLR